eukprot:53948-Rhodomonas_salina.2
MRGSFWYASLLCGVRYWRSLSCAAMSATEIASCAPRLSFRDRVLCYAHATRCPVLRQSIVLCSVGV